MDGTAAKSRVTKKRQVNGGVQKFCRHTRASWSKCACPYVLRYKPPHGKREHVNLDHHFGRHIDSWTEAVRLAGDLRKEIDAGIFRQKVPTPSSAIGASLTHVASAWLNHRYPLGKKKNNRHNVASMLKGIGAYVPEGQDQTLGDWPIATISENVLEQLFLALEWEDGTKTKYAQVLKGLFAWAARQDFIRRTPIDDKSPIIKGKKAAQRRRRVYPAEEAQLLAAAGLRLQLIITSAIDNLFRIGELLALKWRHISPGDETVWVEAEEEGAMKTGHGRRIPVRDRFAAVLATLREEAIADHRPERLAPDAYIFGDEIGGRVYSVDKQWETCVLKAHGHQPVWSRKKGSNALAPESRALLKGINLHFHDLRHEGASRLRRLNVRLELIQLMLGHATLAQTLTYVHDDEFALEEAIALLASRGSSVDRLSPKSTDSDQVALVNRCN